MKALITGCGGLIGSHLADFLIPTLKVYGTIYKDSEISEYEIGEYSRDHLEIIKCNIRDKTEVNQIISELKPDYIFHLAAQSSVVSSWKDAEKTLETNILGTLYLLDAIKKARINPIIEIAASSAEYGLTYEDEIPINESKELRPSSPYAVSKVATDLLAYAYWQSYEMKIIRLRFFNITGPRKRFDACSDFAKGIVEIEKGIRKQLSVGNLESIRDFTDARDAVRAMWLLTERGAPGEAYNICSGKGLKIKDILDKVISLSGKQVRVREVPGKKRPIDDPIFVGDNSKIRGLGWSPEIPIEKTLKDMLDYWRGIIK